MENAKKVLRDLTSDLRSLSEGIHDVNKIIKEVGLAIEGIEKPQEKPPAEAYAKGIDKMERMRELTEEGIREVYRKKKEEFKKMLLEAREKGSSELLKKIVEAGRGCEPCEILIKEILGEDALAGF